MVQGISVNIRSLSLDCELGTVSNWRIQDSEVNLKGMCFNCSWALPGDFSGLAHGEQSTSALLRGSPHSLQKWQMRVLTSSLYVWHQILTRSANTQPSLSFKHCSNSFFNEHFSLFFFFSNFYTKFTCCYSDSSLGMRSRWNVFITLNRLTMVWRVMLHFQLRDFTRHLTELLSRLIFLTYHHRPYLISLERSLVY